jgi:vacuolar-type H+-ATPase subunit I/STV1
MEKKVTRVFGAYEICFQALVAYDRIISIGVSSAELSKVVW